MRDRRNLWFALAIFVITGGPGQSQESGSFSGNAWFDLCVNSEPMCTGYMAAVVDIYQFASVPSYCPPTGPRGATIGQVQDIVVKHLQDHPEKRHLPFIRLTLDALEKAFPCQPKSN